MTILGLPLHRFIAAQLLVALAVHIATKIGEGLHLWD